MSTARIPCFSTTSQAANNGQNNDIGHRFAVFHMNFAVFFEFSSCLYFEKQYLKYPIYLEYCIFTKTNFQWPWPSLRRILVRMLILCMNLWYKLNNRPHNLQHDWSNGNLRYLLTLLLLRICSRCPRCWFSIIVRFPSQSMFMFCSNPFRNGCV